MDLSPEELATAQKLAPDAKHFDKVLFNGRVLLFRNPTKLEYKHFRSVYMQDKGEMQAFEALAGTVVVQPTPAEWLALQDEYPGVGANPHVVQAMHRLTGMASEESAK